VAASVVSIDSFSEFFKAKSPTLKIDSAASTGSSGSYMKYVIFLWPPVVAADAPKRLAPTLHIRRSNWL